MRDAELGSDDVHDALARIVEIVIAIDIVGGNILRQQIDHVAHFRIGDSGDALFAVARRRIVIRHRDGLARLSDLAAVVRQSAKGVERTLVHEVAVDVQQTLVVAARDDNVAVPDFFEHRLRHTVLL